MKQNFEDLQPLMTRAILIGVFVGLPFLGDFFWALGIKCQYIHGFRAYGLYVHRSTYIMIIAYYSYTHKRTCIRTITNMYVYIHIYIY